MSSVHLSYHTDDAQRLAIRHLTLADVRWALRKGVEDFWAMPSHIVFLALIYPIAGLFLARLTYTYNIIPLLFPLMAGFALIGPFAAVGLYELSRRREQGLSVGWREGLGVFRSPGLGALLGLGVVLAFIFIAWLLTAQSLYATLFGLEPPDSLASFLNDVFTTRQGWTLIAVGSVVGFVYAALVLVISVVAFPLILDRHVGVGTAVGASLRVAAVSPLAVAAWGLIVAVSLALGFVLLFAGLAVVIPVLGHATWHLYRRAIG
ncbi:MAG: putative cytochrome c oxidase, subunit [Hyphomicrobiales bacterium]|nr:putative cytochrome c oxidase, subunit [Hyphomicrobiales bacterium]